MNRWWLASAVAFAGCALTLDGAAQVRLASSAAQESNAPGAPTTAGAYAREAALGDMFEIQAGQLAATRAASPDVKSFAQQMVRDHTATSNALKAALQSASIPATPPASLDPRHAAMLRQLQATSGRDFDRLYVQQQMTAHEEALSLHTSYAKAGDTPPLRAFAGTTADKVQSHIDMLRQISPA